MKPNDDPRIIQAVLAFCHSVGDLEELRTIISFDLPVDDRMQFAKEQLPLCSGVADVLVLVRARDVASAVDLDFVRAATAADRTSLDRPAKAFLLSSL